MTAAAEKAEERRERGSKAKKQQSVERKGGEEVAGSRFGPIGPQAPKQADEAKLEGKQD